MLLKIKKLAYGKTITLTDSTTRSWANESGGVKVVINGDNDLLEGTDFNLTLSRNNDVFVAGEHRSTIVDAGAGNDTLDLSDYDNGANPVDVNLATGSSNIGLTSRNFENAVASQTGGRIVGTGSSNIFTANEGDDDFSTGDGDDLILADFDDIDGGDEDYNGGAGTDTLKVSGEDNPTLTNGAAALTLTSVENVEFSDNGTVEVIMTGVAGFFAGAAANTAALTNGIRKVEIVGDVDDKLKIEEAVPANLIGVTFKGMETLSVDDTDAVIGSSTVFSGVIYFDSEQAGDTDNGDAPTAAAAGNAEILVNTTGSIDLSTVVLRGWSDITGNAAGQTLILSNNTLAYVHVDDIDLGGGIDTIVASNTMVLDLSQARLATVGPGLIGVEKLAFGSADRLIIDDGDVVDLETITGTTGTSDLLVLDGAGAAIGADFTGTTVTGVEEIVLDAAGNGSTVTIGKDSLADGTVVRGDTGTDSLKISGSDVNIAPLTFTNIEALDLNGEAVETSVSVFNQFSRFDDLVGGGAIVFSDSGSVTLRATGSDTKLNNDLSLYFASGADTVNFSAVGFIDDKNALTADLGDGADIVNFNDADTLDLGASTIDYGAGNDTLSLGDLAVNTAIEVGTHDGGSGDDTVKFSAGTLAGAGHLASVTSFEKLALAGPTSDDITINLTTETDIEEIDLSADTNALGTNAVDMSLFEGVALKFTGGAGAENYTTLADASTAAVTETVSLGAGNDSITLTSAKVAGSIHTITLGAGRDEIIASETNSITDSWKVMDFNASQDSIDVDAADWISQLVTQGFVNADTPANFVEARDAAFASLATGDWSAFQYGGNTYVIYDAAGGGAYNSAADVIITLVGNHTLTTVGAGANIV